MIHICAVVKKCCLRFMWCSLLFSGKPLKTRRLASFHASVLTRARRQGTLTTTTTTAAAATTTTTATTKNNNNTKRRNNKKKQLIIII